MPPNKVAACEHEFKTMHVHVRQNSMLHCFETSYDMTCYRCQFECRMKEYVYIIYIYIYVYVHASLQQLGMGPCML